MAILCINWIRGDTPKMLEYVRRRRTSPCSTVVIAFASPRHPEPGCELWGGEVANVALLRDRASASILIRQPFTLQYAKEDAPPEIWDEPHFLRVNYVITWVWAAAFAIEAASGFYGDAVLRNSDNLWTGWIIQTLPLIVAAQFTIWYPNRLRRARAPVASTTAPTIADFLGTVTPWITVVGILSLSFGVAPDWFGVALHRRAASSSRRCATPTSARPRPSGPTAGAPRPGSSCTDSRGAALPKPVSGVHPGRHHNRR